MAWLKRPIPNEIKATVLDRVVEMNGRDLYLGENEEFCIPMTFWDNNYREIVSLLTTHRFRSFAEAFDLVQAFESKFADMKSSFRGTVGDSKKMAAACYQDLCKIHRSLKESKALQLAHL